MKGIDGLVKRGLVMSVIAAAGCSMQPVPSGGIHEFALRRLAAESPKPEYPLDVQQRGIGGVVVADVWLGLNGKIDLITIMESPDQKLTDSVTEAIRAWKFRPFVTTKGSEEQELRLNSKLTFYFDAQKGQVLEPEERKAANDSNRSHASPIVVSQAELPAIMASAATPIRIDVRERVAYRVNHQEGTINIPLDELHSRARWEISPSTPVVIECAFEGHVCEVAGNFMSEVGFHKVWVLMPPGPPVEKNRLRVER